MALKSSRTLFLVVVIVGLFFIFGVQPVATGFAVNNVEVNRLVQGGQLIGLFLIVVGSAGYYLSLKNTINKKTEW